MKHSWQSLGDSEISIKSFDVVLSLIETITIEDLSDLVICNGSSLIDMEVDLERVEIACSDNELTLPIAVSRIVILFVDGYGCEECGIRQRQVRFEQLFSQINKFDFEDLYWFSAFSPLEVNHKEPISKFSDH